MVASKFWNIGVLLGAIGIFLGDNTGHEWFEFPRYATPILFAAYAVVAIQGLMTFRDRRHPALAPSQWYLFVAWFWFPWIYSTAQMLLQFFPTRGAMQAVVSGWFVHNLFKVWLTSLALAGLYYFIPKLTQRPLQNRSLAVFGFWTFLLFAPWGGVPSLQAAPNWIPALGTVANTFLLVPVAAIAMDLYLSMGGIGSFRSRPGSGFFFFALAAFVLTNILGAVGQIYPMGTLTRFTLYFPGLRFLELMGLAGMIFAGAFCLVVPLFATEKSPVERFSCTGFRLLAGGAALIGGGLVLGGLLQGAAMSNASAPFIDSARRTIPFLGMATLGWLLVFLGSAGLFFVFARQCVAEICACCAPVASTRNIARARA